MAALLTGGPLISQHAVSTLVEVSVLHVFRFVELSEWLYFVADRAGFQNGISSFVIAGPNRSKIKSFSKASSQSLIDRDSGCFGCGGHLGQRNEYSANWFLRKRAETNP